MSEVHYLGSTGVGRFTPQHVPGELRLIKNFDDYGDGEMDLLLTRQRLEIEKENSAAVAGPFNFQQDNYDEALGVVNAALANIHNAEALHGIGEILIGKAKKSGGKTGAGKFLQKIAKGVKKGAKAVTKVATAPLRLLAKGAMEVYLPKAAPAFLYLFAEENVLPDKMKAKRKKAEKFKNFIVKKLGMKDKHFMAIIRNKLTKNYGRSPESFLAEAIKKIAVKVSGIGGPKGKPASGGSKQKPKPAAHVNKQKAKPANKGKVKEVVTKAGGMEDIWAGQGPEVMKAIQQRKDEQVQDDERERKQENRKAGFTAAKSVVKKAASGDWIGAIMGAIGWLISKLGGKKEGVDFDKDDIPDLAADSGNAFEFGDLKQNYEKLSEPQKEQVKDVAADLIENNTDIVKAAEIIKVKLPYLTPPQVREIAEEVEEGFEEITPVQSVKIARLIKAGPQVRDEILLLEQTGGGTRPGACGC